MDDVIVRIAQGMAEVADAAAKKGIKVGVENHGRLLGRTSQTAKIVELVNRPNFGVNLDFTNFRTVCRAKQSNISFHRSGFDMSLCSYSTQADLAMKTFVLKDGVHPFKTKTKAAETKHFFPKLTNDRKDRFDGNFPFLTIT